jgi:hypothetical protein
VSQSPQTSHDRLPTPPAPATCLAPLNRRAQIFNDYRVIVTGAYDNLGYDGKIKLIGDGAAAAPTDPPTTESPTLELKLASVETLDERTQAWTLRAADIGGIKSLEMSVVGLPQDTYLPVASLLPRSLPRPALAPSSPCLRRFPPV